MKMYASGVTPWYKRGLGALNVQVISGVPYTHMSNQYTRCDLILSDGKSDL